MEDELPSTSSSRSSSSLSSTSASASKENQPKITKWTGRRENFPIVGSILRKSLSITLNLSSSPDQEARRPFRQLSRSSNTPSLASSPLSSFGSGSGNNKKKLLQKQKSSSSGNKRIKCVLVGDSKTGKSALVRAFLQQGQSIIPDHVPTTQDIHDFMKKIDPQDENVGDKDKKMTKSQDVSLQICDTGGQEDMDRLRPLCYSQAQMVIICFSVMNPASFTNVTMKWLPEVKRHCMVQEDPENPLKLLLVGTQSDLRSNVSMLLKLMDDGLAPISESQAMRLARKIGALKYVESSSLTRSNVNHIFDLAMIYGEGKILPKHLAALDMDTGFHGKILPNLTERKLQFWRRWRSRQNNKSSKMKRTVFLPCFV